MPIKIGKKTFKTFKGAERFIKRTKPGIRNPAAFVAEIEQRQTKPKKRKRGK